MAHTDYQKLIDLCIPRCYNADNYFAYKYEIYLKSIDQSNSSDESISQANYDEYMMFMKIQNFVPCYDKWCLHCGDRYNSNNRCSGCKSVYYCSSECQKKSWKIHQKHCPRDLFALCMTCGSKTKVDNKLLDASIKCDNCPVTFCSETCKDRLYDPHVSYDCEYFAKTFL